MLTTLRIPNTDIEASSGLSRNGKACIIAAGDPGLSLLLSSKARIGLGDAAQGKGGVQCPLEPPRRVPFGLTMPEQENLG